MTPTLARKNLTSKRPPLSKYKQNKPTNRDDDEVVEVPEHVRQTFDSLVSIEALRTEIKEEQEKAQEIRKQNAAALKAMVAAQTVTTTVTIEIALTETGTETFKGRSKMDLSHFQTLILLAYRLMWQQWQHPSFRNTVWRRKTRTRTRKRRQMVSRQVELLKFEVDLHFDFLFLVC